MPVPSIALYCSSGSFGGLEMNTARLARWFLESGKAIYLFAVKGSPLLTRAESESVPTISIQRNNRYGDLIRAYRFARLLGKKEISILFVVDNRDLDFAMWVKWFSRGRLITIYQQHMMLGITRKDLFHTCRYLSFNAWVTPLPYMAEEIAAKTRYPRERVHIIPLGLETRKLMAMKKSTPLAREKLHLPLDIPFLGILGRLDPQKGQHLVIEALNQLNHDGFHCHLLIMGESTKGEDALRYEAELHQLVERHGLTSRVHFLGYRDDVSLFFSAIDIFILGSFGETYGMVTIESMLFGVPVVGSDAGGTPELLGQGNYGWLYPPRDVNAITKAVQTILIQPESTQKKVAMAQEYATTTFSHGAECAQLNALMSELLTTYNYHPLR